MTSPSVSQPRVLVTGGTGLIGPHAVARPMPFKHPAAPRHPFPRARYRVTNWSAYEASLRRRDSLTTWFCEPVIGERLRAHRDEGRRTGLIIAGNLLDRMFRMARPSYIRVA